MADFMKCRASALLNIEDDYTAWCLDEAEATIMSALRQGKKIRPKKTTDNKALIKKLTEG